MKNVAQKRAFSLTMVVAILATSILACAFTPNNTTDSTDTTADQQCPFEENEKEFEDDKDEVDEKSVELIFIAEVYFFCSYRHQDQKIQLPATFDIPRNPLFLTYHRFLI